MPTGCLVQGRVSVYTHPSPPRKIRHLQRVSYRQYRDGLAPVHTLNTSNGPLDSCTMHAAPPCKIRHTSTVGILQGGVSPSPSPRPGQCRQHTQSLSCSCLHVPAAGPVCAWLAILPAHQSTTQARLGIRGWVPSPFTTISRSLLPRSRKIEITPVYSAHARCQYRPIRYFSVEQPCYSAGQQVPDTKPWFQQQGIPVLETGEPVLETQPRAMRARASTEVPYLTWDPAAGRRR